jgi:integrase
MAIVRIRYIHSFVDKTGRVRFYFRYRHKRWPLPGQPGSIEFAQRYDELKSSVVLPKGSSSRIAFGPGTLGWVIEKWTGSDDFKKRKSSTQVLYRRFLDSIRERYGRGLMVDLRERHVRSMRAEFTKHTSSADRFVTLVSLLWVFAKENLAMELGPNPTRDIQKLHTQSSEHQPWPASLISEFDAKAKPRPNMQLALALLLYTGQRLGDVAAMKWSQYDGRGILVRQEKTDELVWIPCHRRLKKALDEAERRSDFILTTHFGSRYSTGSLSNVISLVAAAIGAKGYTAHGLRKNAGIALAEVGCTDKEIMAVLGHKTYAQSHAYTRRAEQKRLAEQAIRKLERAEKVANPRTKRDS